VLEIDSSVLVGFVAVRRIVAEERDLTLELLVVLPADERSAEDEHEEELLIFTTFDSAGFLLLRDFTPFFSSLFEMRFCAVVGFLAMGTMGGARTTGTVFTAGTESSSSLLLELLLPDPLVDDAVDVDESLDSAGFFDSSLDLDAVDSSLLSLLLPELLELLLALALALLLQLVERLDIKMNDYYIKILNYIKTCISS